MCRGKKRRLTLIILFSFLLLLFAINSYLLKLDHDAYRELIISLKVIARRSSAIEDKRFRSSFNDRINKSSLFNDMECMPRPLPVVESGEWIVNPRVAQYSSYLTVLNDFVKTSGERNDKQDEDDEGDYSRMYDDPNRNIPRSRRRRRPIRRRVMLETLVLFDYPFLNERYIRSRAKLVVRVADDEFELADIEQVFRRRIFSSEDNLLRYMWKLTTTVSVDVTERDASGCRVPALDKIAIATIDIDELQNLIWTGDNNNDDDDNENQQLSYLNSLIVFQKPTIIDRGDCDDSTGGRHQVNRNKTTKKKKAIAHCVHMLRNLDESRLGKLFDWLRLQKSVGYDKIRLYAYRVDELVREQIRRFDTNLIEMTTHDIEFESVCRYQISLLKTGKF